MNQVKPKKFSFYAEVSKILLFAIKREKIFKIYCINSRIDEILCWYLYQLLRRSAGRETMRLCAELTTTLCRALL